ncbi:F-box only protein 21-like [Anneissia japonica]|uniref:F-box only protein 21-like n=1 Tax=Anneissia japonica TaxID=1529436 RepID=UPI0014256719|nr:F-box only protein 21-like [Anneissia japonica]
MQAVHLENLPDELLEYILFNRVLEAQDILSFGCTCKRFQSISYSNEIWKRTLLRRWPELGQISDSLDASKHNWQELYKFRFRCIRNVEILLQDLVNECYEQREVSYKRFTPFQQLAAEYEADVGNVCVEEQLLDVLNEGDSFQNLTQKYYAVRALRYLQHPRLEKDFLKFLDAPEDQQSLEDGAIVIAQWNQSGTRVNKKEIYERLDQLAERVRLQVCIRYGDEHPASQGSVDEPLSVDQSTFVLDVLNTIFYEVENFEGNKDDYYNPNNSFIDKVLETKQGIPISLAVIYSAVARRLGITLDPVNFPNHFILRLDVQPMQKNNANKYKYIDVFHSGQRLSNVECYSLSPMMNTFGIGSEYFRACSTRAVYVRMVANLMRLTSHLDDVRMLDGYELFLLLCSDDEDAAITLRRFYLQSGMNVQEVLDYLRQCHPTTNNMLTLKKYMIREAHTLLEEEENPNKVITVKRRADHQEVEYSVGMIMRHRRYDYMCVIYGWDPLCEMSENWKSQMGVDRLPNKDRQPFYNVLVADQSKRYAAQESLMIEANPQVITHSEVGKHFVEFKGNYYLANEEVIKRYPDDMHVTTRMALQNRN